MALSGKSVIRTKIRVEDSRKSTKDVEGFTKSLQGLTNIAKGSAAGLAAFGPHAAAAAAGIAAIGVAAGITTKAILGLARAFGELVDRGSRFSAVAVGFERLADPAIIGQLQEMTAWQVRQVDIMRSYNEVMEVGIIEQDDYADAIGVVTQRAQAMGENVTQMIQGLSGALTGRGFEMFARLGVEMGQVNDQAQHSAESHLGRIERINLALEQLRDRNRETGAAVGSLGDAWNAASNKMNDYIDNMGRVIAESPALVGVFNELTVTLESVGISAQEMGRWVANSIRVVVAGVAHGVITMADILEDFFELFMRGQMLFSQESFFGQILRRIGIIGDAPIDASRRLAELMRNISAAATRIRGVALSAPVDAPGTERTGPRRFRPAGGDGDGEEAARQFAELMDDIIEDQEHQIELENELQSVRLANIMELNELRGTLTEFWAEQDEAQIARAQELGDAQKEAIESLLEKEAEADEARLERQEEVFGTISSLANSTNKIFTSVSSVIGAISGDTEEAAKRQGRFIIAFSGVMAAVELAQSIKSFASQDYAAGVAHLASMAAFIAAAAQASADLGGGTAKQPAAGGTFTPAATEQATAPAAEGGGVTIVENYSFGRSGEELGENLRDADWTFQSSGSVSNRGLAAEFGA
jgi:hypothetical protein